MEKYHFKYRDHTLTSFVVGYLLIDMRSISYIEVKNTC